MDQVEAIKRGNEKVFVEVYDECHAKLFYYFLKRTQARETAKELTQNTFIKLWHSRQTLSGAHPINTQIFTIANSVLIDHLRREAVARKYLSVIAEDEREHPVVHSNTLFESSDYIKAAASQLPPVRRNVFLLKITKGYSNREIAEQLSISIKTVEDHYTKAINQLRSLSFLFPLFFLFSALLS